MVIKMDQLILWGVITAVVAVWFAGAKLAKKGEWHEDFLSLSTSKSLLGIVAVLIVLHHLAQLLGNLQMEQGPLAYLEYVGVCFVGLFFFFSGYGLFYSKNHSANYFKGFFRKRLSKVLVPFYFCIIIFVGFSLMMQMPMQPAEMIVYLSGWWLLNNQMWYVVEIVFFYIAFYCVFRVVKKETTGLIIMGILIGIMVCASILIGHGPECASDKWLQGEWWFNTSFMFLFGMIAAKHEEKLLAFAKKHYIVILVISTLATIGLGIPTISMVNAGSYYCEYEPSFTLATIFGIKFMTLLVQFSMVFFFVVCVLLIMMKVKCHNAVTKFLGKISLELYLIHNLYLIMFGYIGIGNITQPAMLVIVSLACSLLTAFVIHIPVTFISNVIAGRKKQTYSVR